MTGQVISRTRRLVDDWRRVLVVVAIASFGISILREFAAPGRPTPGTDAAFFQHAGWYITQGAVPYLHIWDIKPPMTHLTTTALATVSFGNMFVLHVLSVLLMATAGVAIVVLVGELTHRLTGDAVASLAAGLCVLTIGGFHHLAAQGFYPKYLAIALGLSGILLQYRDRPGYSGVVAALGAGYIQHAAVFSILILGLAVQRHGRDGARTTLLGMVATTAVVIAPILAWGAGEAMVVEVVLALLVGSEPSGPLELLRRLGKGLVLTGYAGIPILFGVYGLVRVGTRDLRELWWLVAGGALYGLQIFLFDFDSYPDLFFGLVFVSIGIGLLVHTLRGRKRQAIVAMLVAVVTMSVVFLGGVGVVTNETVYTQSLDDSLDSSDTVIHSTVKYVEALFGAEPMRRDSVYDQADTPSDRMSVTELFWTKGIPASCHYRLSGTEILWLERTGEPYTAQTCGAWP